MKDLGFTVKGISLWENDAVIKQLLLFCDPNADLSEEKIMNSFWIAASQWVDILLERNITAHASHSI